MDMYERMRRPEPFAAAFDKMPNEMQMRAKTLCWRYNATAPDESEARRRILDELLGTSGPRVFIEPPFHCDFGFNIHFLGLAVVNYNCVILDTSPVTIGSGAFIAPGVVLACAGHAIHPDDRSQGIETSAPITLGENVWIGANATVTAGVEIGSGSIIGAGSTVTRDIPAGVVAVGSPCRPIREITDADRLDVGEAYL